MLPLQILRSRYEEIKSSLYQYIRLLSLVQSDVVLEFDNEFILLASSSLMYESFVYNIFECRLPVIDTLGI